jgi:hypothetical protein
MMYKLSNPLQKNPMMEIFREFALKDRLPFQAMLAIASKHLASVEGQSESLQSLGHKTQTLQLINKTIRDTSDDQLDNFIYAVATMAVIEVCHLLLAVNTKRCTDWWTEMVQGPLDRKNAHQRPCPVSSQKRRHANVESREAFFGASHILVISLSVTEQHDTNKTLGLISAVPPRQ